VYQVGTNKGMT